METMSIERVLEITVNSLSQIKVPISMLGEIGMPIAQSIHNLRMCIEAIQREQPEEKEGDEADV